MNNHLLPAADMGKLDGISVKPKNQNMESGAEFTDSLKQVQEDNKVLKGKNTAAKDSAIVHDKGANAKKSLSSENPTSLEANVEADKSSSAVEFSEVAISEDSIVEHLNSVSPDELSQLGALFQQTLPIDSSSLNLISQDSKVNNLFNVATEGSAEELMSVLMSLDDDNIVSQLSSILSPEELELLKNEFDLDGNTLPLTQVALSVIDKVRQLAQMLNEGGLASKEGLVASQSNTLLKADLSASQLEEHTTSLRNQIQSNNSNSSLLATADLQKQNTGVAITNEVGVLAFNTLDETSLVVKEQSDIAELVSIKDSKTPSQLLASDLTQSPLLNTNTSSKAQLSIVSPFQQVQWGQEVAERVMWMSSKGLQEAEIHLDPPELGPMQVKVSVANEQAHVSFVVQHGSVREALDQNAMRLRDMFEGENINLVDVDVSDQSQQDQDANQSQQSESEAKAVEDSELLTAETKLTYSPYGASLISTYA